MARSKQNKSQTKKVDGKYRQETREERRLRLKQQEEAREQCVKLLPYAGGAMLVFMIMFAIYVRSVPPVKIPKPEPPIIQVTPDFMNIDTQTVGKEPVLDTATGEVKVETEPEPASEPFVEAAATEETIEL